MPRMRWSKPEGSGFRDAPKEKQCRHPEHQPPLHLYIPPGKEYVHICPQCKQRTVLGGSNVSW